MGSYPPPPAYEPFAAHDDYDEHVTRRERRQPDGCPTPLQAILGVLVCVIGGYWLATSLYNNAAKNNQNLVPDMELHGQSTVQARQVGQLSTERAVNLNPFASFTTAGNSGVKVHRVHRAS